MIVESNKPFHEMIAKCRESFEKLNDWERNFIESLEKDMNIGFSVTPNQSFYLNKILRKASK